jgi:hypothetical protein
MRGVKMDPIRRSEMSKKPDMEYAVTIASAALGLTRRQRDVLEKMLVQKREKEDARKSEKVVQP